MAVQVAATLSSGFSGKSTKLRYDVFLSFIGKDTRHSFTVPLYDALRRKGIIPFIDARELGKRECIVTTLRKAIERSRISIIVFSINYATSSWCLDELAHINWCMKEKNQLVVPIFYKVDPKDVQYQRNSFEEAMAAHEERFRNEAEKVRKSFEEKLQKWRSALSEAASVSSAWVLEDGYDEGVFIESIVEDVYARLAPNYEQPKKLLRKFDNNKKGTRRIKRSHTFHSCYRRKKVFPMGNKLVWRFLYH